MPKGDRNSDRLRIAADRQGAGTADELREELLRMELVEQQGQERTRPGERRGTFGEEPKQAETKRTAPAFGVSYVLVPYRLEPPSFRLK
jgi:hypothetical protein